MLGILLLLIYLAFISLGLPDGMLGAAWPAMRLGMHLPVSYMGILTTITSVTTIYSSIQSDRLNKKYGTGLVTSVSVGLTALAILGYSFSHSFWQICLLSIPYGLGAGGVDAALNNYVALHYSSKHMSWLHCMWGLGATTGTYALGYSLSQGQDWHFGYLLVGLIQVLLTAYLFMKLPLWQKKQESKSQQTPRALTIKDIFAIKGAKEIMVTFFAYCALESIVGLWASSYLVEAKGLSISLAASFASLFYLGVTLGRGLSGFLAICFSNDSLVKMGEFGIGIGIAVLFLPIQNDWLTLLGLLLIGLGCAPIYPCIIHSTPEHFGKENSQAMIGLEMAVAYIGYVLMPPLFGLLAQYFSMQLFTYLLSLLLIVMTLMYLKVIKIHH